jgi:hypothetical protein
MSKTKAQKLWEAAHPEKVREYQEDYDIKNRSKRLAQKRAWWNRKKYGKSTRPDWAAGIVGNKGRKLRDWGA